MNKRSKKGCFSCKKLRIKCDESLPRCEYCRHTNRECEYPKPVVKKKRIRKSLALTKAQPPQESSSPNQTGVSVEYKSISRISSPEFEKLVCEQEERSYNQFVFNKTLTKPHLQLSISKFEYRLLDFFHNFCIERFSLATNSVVQLIWKNEVPALFLRSRLVRCSIFSFAALNLTPLCDLNQLSLEAKRLEYYNRFEPELNEFAIFDPHRSSNENMQRLHTITITYFLEATKLSNRLVEDNLSAGSPDALENACQLAISSILILSFLSLQPDNVTPLVFWDKSECDFLSLSRGIYHTIKDCMPIIASSKFAGLFVPKQHVDDPPAHDSFPISKRLYEDFQKEYPEEGEEAAASERDDILVALDMFHMLLHRSIVLDNPNPIFRWAVIIQDEFRDLVYSKHFFALHILYIYSTLAILVRFELFGQDNLWLAYMRWYKRRNFMLFGCWKYPADEFLYIFAHSKLKRFTSCKSLAKFDPEQPSCDGLFSL